MDIAYTIVYCAKIYCAVLQVLLHSLFCHPGYLPQLNTVTLEEQIPRYNGRLHACHVNSSMNQQILYRTVITVLLCSEFALWRPQTWTIPIARCLSTGKANGRYS